MNQDEIMKKIVEIERENLSKRNIDVRRDNSIQSIIHIGNIKGKDIYRIAEENLKDNYSAIIYKYFDEKGKLQGIKNENPRGEKEWILNSGEEIDSIKDEIDKNEELIEKILEELGLEEKDIDKISELDLGQQLKEKNEDEQDIEEIDEDEKDNEEEKEEDVEEKEEKEEEPEELEKFEQTSEYKNNMKEIDTAKRIDQKGTTLGRALGMNEYSKILVIHSSNVNNIKDKDGKQERNSSKKIALLGITVRDGKQVVEKIPDNKLRYYRGSNNESMRFDDNELVEKNSKTTERFVVPGTNKGLAIEKSDMQTKVYYQGGIDRDDNTAVMERVEDTNTGRIPMETKELFNYNRGIYKEDKMNDEKDKLHKEDEDEKIDRENADGDLNTVSEHIHEINENSKIVYNGQLMSVSEVAENSRFKISSEHFVELYNENAKKFEGKEEIDMDKLYENIEEDVNEELENPQQR